MSRALVIARAIASIAVAAAGAACGGGGGSSQTCASLGVPPEGTCFGEQLVTCTADGYAKGADCDDACLVNEDGTPTCFTLPAGSSLVKGTVVYEDKPPTVGGGFGPLRTLPVRGAAVSVVSSSGTVLSTRSTSETGNFAVDYVAAAGEQVYVLVSAASNNVGRPGKIKNSSGKIYGLESDTFTAARDTQLALVAGQSGLGRAFNLFDQGVLAADYIRTNMNEPQVKAFSIYWYAGSNDGSYFDGQNIHLVGNVGDDDGNDDAVIMHEIGHYMAHNYSIDDSPGGAHDGTPTSPKLAWSEGFATYFSLAVRNETFYADSNSQGGFGYNLETGVTKVPAGGSENQQVSEDMVAEILLDAGDADRENASDDDSVTDMGHPQVLAIAQGFQDNDPGAGVTGIDLTDWLAAVFAGGANGEHCAGLLDIVLTERRFPFPYSCP